MVPPNRVMCGASDFCHSDWVVLFKNTVGTEGAEAPVPQGQRTRIPGGNAAGRGASAGRMPPYLMKGPTKEGL